MVQLIGPQSPYPIRFIFCFPVLAFFLSFFSFKPYRFLVPTNNYKPQKKKKGKNENFILVQLGFLRVQAQFFLSLSSRLSLLSLLLLVGNPRSGELQSGYSTSISPWNCLSFVRVSGNRLFLFGLLLRSGFFFFLFYNFFRYKLFSDVIFSLFIFFLLIVSIPLVSSVWLTRISMFLCGFDVKPLFRFSNLMFLFWYFPLKLLFQFFLVFQSIVFIRDSKALFFSPQNFKLRSKIQNTLMTILFICLLCLIYLVRIL